MTEVFYEALAALVRKYGVAIEGELKIGRPESLDTAVYIQWNGYEHASVKIEITNTREYEGPLS